MPRRKHENAEPADPDAEKTGEVMSAWVPVAVAKAIKDDAKRDRRSHSFVIAEHLIRAYRDRVPSAA